MDIESTLKVGPKLETPNTSTLDFQWTPKQSETGTSKEIRVGTFNVRKKNTSETAHLKVIHS